MGGGVSFGEPGGSHIIISMAITLVLAFYIGISLGIISPDIFFVTKRLHLVTSRGII